MQKILYTSLLAATALAESVLTYDTQDELVYTGGMGTAASKAVFNLISDDLIADGRATTSGAAAGTMSVEFYYKEVDDIWEYHGNLYFNTSWKPAKNCKFGFYWSETSDGSSMADGFEATFDGS